MRRSAVIRALVPMLAILTAPAGASTLSFNGEGRPRFELRNPGAIRKAVTDESLSMRIRAGLVATLDRNLAAVVQVQDLFWLWGPFELENPEKGSAIEVFLGYLEFGQILGAPLEARIGRQTVALGEERLIGSNDWAQRGRALDGARIAWRPSWGSIEGLIFQVTNRTDPRIPDKARLVGLSGGPKLPFGRSVELYALYDEVVDSPTKQLTVGGRGTVRWRSLSGRVESALQTGERRDKDVSAFLGAISLRGSWWEEKLSVGVWYDYLSGQESPDSSKIRSFDTLFGSAHEFYGLADYVGVAPEDTGDHGLQDFALKARYGPLSMELHRFLFAEPGYLSSRDLGWEIDVAGSFRTGQHITVEAGVCFVKAEEPIRAVRGGRENHVFGYIGPSVKF